MVNSRVSVTEETRDELKDFANGLGATYDETIKFLLDMIRAGDEDNLLAGRRLRSELDKWHKKNPSSK